MADSERLKKGKEVFKKTYGSVLPVPETLSPYSEFVLTTLFAEVLPRETIKMRDKRLLIIGALAGLGADPALFEIHARAALENGEIAHEELDEFLLVLVNYCGQPRMAPLSMVCRKLLAERAGTKTAQGESSFMNQYNQYMGKP
jgi:4-carboxymuconolactone decarboxylase